MADSKQDALMDIHSKALVDFARIYAGQEEGRRLSLEDRRFCFVAGAQWEGKLGEQFENKPKLEVNKVLLAIIRIFNEYRNNRITVDFVSKDGDSTDDLADLCDGLYRADEMDSSAQEAYDNAFEEGVVGGFGAWRLRAEYEDEYDEDDERQRIRIEPIFEADQRVFFDDMAQKQDKSDARYCFVLTPMTPEAYKETYDDDPESWPKVGEDQSFDWFTPQLVFVAELYKVEEVEQDVFFYRTLDGDEVKVTEADIEIDEGLIDEMAAKGAVVDRTRKVKRRRVRKYIMSGGGVLEDCGYIAGREIPIIPFYGRRAFVENIERFSGHVRPAKDAQRLKNMQISALALQAAQSPTEKPIFAPEQVQAYSQLWATDQVQDYAYLLAEPLRNDSGDIVAAGPAAYTKPISVSPVMSALLQLSENDMQDILGRQDGADKIVSNISGDAVEMIQNRLDMVAYIYLSNMAKAVARAGKVWLSMAADVFVEDDRRMKTVGRQDEVDTAVLRQRVINDSGKTVLANDISKAKMDVGVDVGPASASKRQSIVRSITGMLQMVSDQSDQAVLVATAMMNMDGEGIKDVREYFRKKLVKMGALDPTDEDIREAEAAGEQKDPQSTYLEAEADKAIADAEKTRIDAQLSAAKIEETRAKTIETLAKVERQ